MTFKRNQIVIIKKLSTLDNYHSIVQLKETYKGRLIYPIKKGKPLALQIRQNGFDVILVYTMKLKKIISEHDSEMIFENNSGRYKITLVRKKSSLILTKTLKR